MATHTRLAFIYIKHAYISCNNNLYQWRHGLLRRASTSKPYMKLRCFMHSIILHLKRSTAFFFRGIEYALPLSIEGPWYLYGRCDLSLWPLRLGAQHGKLCFCCSP